MSKKHSLPPAAYVDVQGEQVAFQELLETTVIPCREHTDLFFADADDESELDDPSIAEDMCLDCPLFFQCQQFAEQSAIEYGVYGGMRASKRMRILRNRKRRKGTR